MGRRRRTPADATAGDRGVAVAGDVVGSLIVTGDNVSVELKVGPESGALIEQVGLQQRPRVRKRRPAPPPPRSADHVDREAEATRVLALLAAGPVNVHGEPGVGKTYLLRDVATRAPGGGDRDGVAFVFARAKTRPELLQELFDAFFDSRPPTKPSEVQIVRALGGRPIAAVVDALELDREETQALVSVLPRAAIVVASNMRVFWDSEGLGLEGLTLEDSEALIAQELGRPLGTDEAAAVAWLWRALEGHPLRLRQAAAVAKAQRQQLSAPAATTSDVRHMWFEAAIGQLSGDERLLLGVLVQLGGADVGAERLAGFLGRSDVTAELDKLRSLGLAEAHSPRYSATEDALAELAEDPRLASMTPSDVVGSMLAWLRHEPSPNDVGRELPALVAAVRLAQTTEQPKNVVALGRAFEPELALSRRWDAWEEVLLRVLSAARSLDDRDAEAWALHELGTRAACLGDVATATGLLGEALELRHGLGDGEGSWVSDHNLRVARRRPGLATRLANRWFFTTSLALVGAVVVAILLLAAGTGAAVAALLDRDDTTPMLAVQLTGDGTGSVLINPAGVRCTADCEWELSGSASLVLTAAAAAGSRFVAWDGCPKVNGNACELRLTEDTTVGASFVVKASDLVTLSVTTANGTVTSSDGSIECPPDPACQAEYPVGEQVTLTATPDTGYTFDRWDGCTTATGSTCELTLDADTGVTASFLATPTTTTSEATLVVNVASADPAAGSSGRVTSADGAIDCPDKVCRNSYDAGTAVTLTATAADGSVFDSWQGCDSPSETTCDLTLDDSTTVTAVFRAATATLTVQIGTRSPQDAQAGGSVSSDDETISCPGTCEHPFEPGTTVTLTPTPDRASEFSGWENCPSVDGTDCRITLDADTTVKAVFRLPTVDVTVTGGTLTYGPGNSRCSAECTASFARGTSLTFDATPSSSGESTVVNWGGACEGTDAGDTSCTITVDGDTSVSADITTAVG